MIKSRSPDTVMRLERMGSFHQSRLSFLRHLLRQIKHQKWLFKRNAWCMNADGVGHAVYTVTTPKRSYSLVAFGNKISNKERSDRVIATVWDATFCLFDGIPDTEQIARLKANVPLQEAGRITEQEISLSRANKSVRIWDYTVDCLSKGIQPDIEKINQVGYLMRTTAVYGSGKFGAAVRSAICDRSEFTAPFQTEMLSVWLTRSFTFDWIEHMARSKNHKQAVPLSLSIKSHIGVGNSTGLGMAPFLINHPILLHHWMVAKETALAKVRAIKDPDNEKITQFHNALKRAQNNLSNWYSQHPIQVTKNQQLAKDLIKIENAKDELITDWNQFYLWSVAHLSIEGQEQFVSLMLEPYPELVDNLVDSMSCNEEDGFTIEGTMELNALQQLIDTNYQWTRAIDFNEPKNKAKFWYASEEKLEPRIGQRFEETGAEREHPFNIAEQVQWLADVLHKNNSLQYVSELLFEHPNLRYIVRRVQINARYPYSEIRDNLVADDMLAIDMLRCKLSFFGANQFDPRSDRWVRINLFQDAPLPEHICQTH